MNRPDSASIYKKKQGEIQFGFRTPVYDEKGFIKQKGGIMVEAAKSIPDSEKSDWDNKVVLMLAPKDLAEILGKVRKNKPDDKGVLAHLFHEYNDEKKTFTVSQGQNDTWRVQVTGPGKTSKEQVCVGVFFTVGEMTLFMTLAEAAISLGLGWI